MGLDVPTGLRLGPDDRGDTVSCVVDDAMWDVLRGLEQEVLFHPDLFPVLNALPRLIVEGDPRDTITDLVLNGHGLDG